MESPAQDASPSSTKSSFFRRISSIHSPRNGLHPFAFTSFFHRKDLGTAGSRDSEPSGAHPPGLLRIRTTSPTWENWAVAVQNDSQEWLSGPPPGKKPKLGADEEIHLSPRSRTSGRLSQAEIIAALPPLITTKTIRKESPNLTPVEDDGRSSSPMGGCILSHYRSAARDFACPFSSGSFSASIYALPPSPPESPEDLDSSPLTRRWTLALPESSQAHTPNQLADYELRFNERQSVDATFGLAVNISSTNVGRATVEDVRMSHDGISLRSSTSLIRGVSHTEYVVPEDEFEPETEVVSKKRGRKRSVRDSIMHTFRKRPRL